MKIAKLINKNQIESTWFAEEEDIPIAFIEQGFKPIITDDTPIYPSQFQRIEYEYIDTGDQIIQKGILVPDYEAEIAWNRAQLDALDWKTTRNMIAEKAKQPLPISWEDIYIETQQYRDRINYLETLI